MHLSLERREETMGKDTCPAEVDQKLERRSNVYKIFCRSYRCNHDIAIVERCCFDGDQTVVITDVVGDCTPFLKYQTIDAPMGQDFPRCEVDILHSIDVANVISSVSCCDQKQIRSDLRARRILQILIQAH